MGVRDRTDLEAQEILDSLPMFAMVLDENHQVVMANSLFAVTVADEGDECPVVCYQSVHGSDGPHPDCPLVEAARTNRTVKREITDGVQGTVTVTVVPIAGRFGRDRLFLHLTEAT